MFVEWMSECLEMGEGQMKGSVGAATGKGTIGKQDPKVHKGNRRAAAFMLKVRLGGSPREYPILK